MASKSATKDVAPARLDPALIRLGLALALGVFMSMLDTTIVNVALPHIGTDLDTDLSTLQWVVTGYMLALAMAIPTTGWLTARIGAKPLFVSTTAVFAIASGMCALAWNVESLIVFRVIQGAGGALLMPLAQAILARASGPERMGRVMAIVGLPALMAPVLGPIIGGLIVDNAAWQWIFLINVPIGVVSVALSLRVLPPQAREQTESFDFIGLGLLCPGIALVIYGLSRAGTAADFGAVSAWVPITLGAVLVATYVGHAARRGKAALIPLAFLRDRVFAASSMVTFTIGITVQGVLLLLTIYYQQARDASALTTGLLLIPQGVGTAVSMPIAGRLTDRAGARPVVTAGMIAVTLSTVPFALATDTTPYPLLAAALLLRGLGFGATMMPAMAAGYRNLPANLTEHATSALHIFSRTGGAVGGALLIVLLSNHLDQGDVSDAFQTSFWWATGLTAGGTLAATMLPGGTATGSRSAIATPHSPSDEDGRH